MLSSRECIIFLLFLVVSAGPSSNLLRGYGDKDLLTNPLITGFGEPVGVSEKTRYKYIGI
jgi:hypothetical protein